MLQALAFYFFSAILIASAVMVIAAKNPVHSVLFLGGWLPPLNIVPFTLVPGVIWFLLKLAFLFFMMAMVKAIVPRYRYDQLMRLGWKIFLPTSLLWVVLTAAWVLVFHHHA